MPRKPQIKTINASPETTATILNAIKNDVGVMASNVPYLDLEIQHFADSQLSTLRNIGEIVTSYQPLANAYLSALVNRIGLVWISSRSYENPWAFFKKGIMEFGETVEDVFVNIANVQPYDPQAAASTVFAREIPDVRTAFHTMNYQEFYKITVSNDQLRQAFLSWQGITNLIAKMVDSLYTSANFDEFVTMKYLIAKSILNGGVQGVTIPTVSAENANSIITQIKGISGDFTFMDTQFNPSGVTTYTPKENQYLIATVQFNSVVDVNVLAKAFNLDYAKFMGRTVEVNSFAMTTAENQRLAQLFANDPNYAEISGADLTLLQSVGAVLTDENFFMVLDNLQNFTEQYNAQGLYWNYFYHVWKTFGVSPFSNRVAFTTQTGSVTGVTISPQTPTVTPGQNVQFTANVATTGIVNEGVFWEVTGNNEYTTINQQGLLTVGSGETASSVTVKATSLSDSSKSAETTVTITQA